MINVLKRCRCMVWALVFISPVIMAKPLALVPNVKSIRINSDKNMDYVSTNLINKQALSPNKTWDTSIKKEGYRLEISDKIDIFASSETGFFYAQQTLAQLLHNHESIPSLVINDFPTYPWRGSMIDVARHFRSIDYLKKHIQRMAYFKLNVLHLHLTDDQGWRIEIKGWPKLTEVGAKWAVGKRQGGFYTQAEMTELIEYARLYHVMIVPEIDMPGHIQAALASYPQLACEGDDTNIYTGVLVGFSHLCLAKPEVVMPFVKEVITQMTALFPSPYFHIGGDETTVSGYQHFIETVNELINEQGKIMIGWEEVVDANVSQNTIIQYWQPAKNKLQTAQAKELSLILSPCRYTYLDHGNHYMEKNVAFWCNIFGISLKKMYEFDPQNYPTAKGIEAALWSEFVITEQDADRQQWPRLAAIADLSWHKKDHWQDFVERLSPFKSWFEKHEIEYFPTESLGWKH